VENHHHRLPAIASKTIDLKRAGCPDGLVAFATVRPLYPDNDVITWLHLEHCVRLRAAGNFQHRHHIPLQAESWQQCGNYGMIMI